MLSRRSLFRAGGGLALAATALADSTSWNASAATSQWNILRSRLQGTLVLPTDSGFAAAKQLQLGQYDAVNPQAVAYCQNADDVRTCVLFSQYTGTPLRVRSGGHNLAGWSTGDNALIVDLSRINQATVTGSTVQLGPGTQSIDALSQLKPYNKQVIAGTCPTVCAGGFLSGGGLGWQTRKFGIGADHVVSARVATSDGRITYCSPFVEPDLYWAVRGGGGGNFGIVVNFEVTPIDAPVLTAYETVWSFDNAATTIAAWEHWTANAPRELGSSLIVVPPNGYYGYPSSNPLVRIYGGYHGVQADADAQLDQLALAVGAKPLSRTSQQFGFADGMQYLYGCGDITELACHRAGSNPDAVLPRTPNQRQSYRLIDRQLTTADATDVLNAWSAHPELPYRFLQSFALGGAANDVPSGATAYVHRSAQSLLGYQVGFQDSTDVPAADDWAAAGAAALAPRAGGSYINFPSSVMNGDWAADNYGDNYARLVQVKYAYDPTDLFQHPQSVGS
ncbi:FAD-binding oxidoreductase [Kitasatospora mediocidica]|uniref:FAD-binding oxidoreductase n=1 Tax=Kitasatospora mediocidica TaxID=58352 RepID=UPI00068E5563|nr:FAD-dependent oxidoreductase [Kitasatospora mediocidica]